MKLYQIQIDNKLDDEISDQLLDLEVAISTENLSTVIYFTEDILEQVQEILKDHITTLTEIPDQNWVQKSQEVWKDVGFSSFKVVPVTEGREKNSDEILIIPGTGFGTGQHATTYMMLDEISNLQISPTRVLDFGTGSGILSIAVAKKFNLPVLATDNDPLAIENAKDNVRINQQENLVELRVQALENIDCDFDLILANIYAEVLCFFSNDLINKLSGNGTLLLSGILPEKSQMVEEHFASLELVKKRVQDNWVLLYFKKKI